MNIDKLKKLNQLAKTLKETGMAPSMDDAIKMAEKMMQEGDKTIAELTGEQKEKQSAEQLIAKAVHEEGFVDKVKEKVKEIIGDVEGIAKKEEEPGEEIEEEEKFILKKPSEEKGEEQTEIKQKEE